MVMSGREGQVGKARGANRLLPRSELFQHRAFAVFWIAGLGSAMGTWLQNVSGALVVLDLKGSAAWVGALGFVGFGPMFFFSLPAGLLADRVSRMLLIRVTHIVSGLATGVLALAAATDRLNVQLLFVVAFITGTSYAIAKPAMQAFVPRLVPRNQLRAAVAANSSQFLLAQVIGPGIAGVVVAVFGAEWAFGLNALSYTGPVISMSYIARHPVSFDEDPVEKVASTASNVKLVPYLGANQHLVLLLTAVATSNWVLEALRTLSPVLAVAVLDAGEEAAGTIISAYGVGAVLTIAATSGTLSRRAPLPMALAGYIIVGAAVVLLAESKSLALAFVAAAAAGVGHVLSSIVLTSVVQDIVPDAMRGRVMSVHTIAALGVRPFAALAVGALATQLDARQALLVWAGFVVVALVAVAQLARTSDGWKRWSPTHPTTNRSAPSLLRSSVAPDVDDARKSDAT